MNRRQAALRAAVSASAASLALIASFTFGEGKASANPMDLAPERLTQRCTPKANPGNPDVPCGEAFIAPAGGANITNYYRPDNAAWAKLVSQYAMAIAPTAMHPARTTGYGGFEMSLFGSLTVGYDATAGDACLREMRAAQANPDFCGGGGGNKLAPSCEKVFPRSSGGTKKPGDACSTDSECATSAQGRVSCASKTETGASLSL